MQLNSSQPISSSEERQKQKNSSEQQSDDIAKSFEQNGNLLFKDQSKLVYQCGCYVLKEVVFSTPQTTQIGSSCPSNELQSNQVQATFPPSPTSIQSQKDEMDSKLMMQKKIKDCFFLQNEFLASLQMKGCENKHIVKPIDFKKTDSRCMLFTPYLSEKDAYTHLYLKNEGMFNKILQYLSHTTSQNMSEELKIELTKTRNVLFGTMKLIIQIGSALQYLHDELNMAHNDIKPDNFFAHYGQHPLIPCSNQYSNQCSQDDDGVNYYLGDFGYAKPVGFTQDEAKNFFLQKLPFYFSPEIIAWLQDGSIDFQKFEKQYDVFAFGVSIFQILFQTSPFQSQGCHISDQLYNYLQNNPEKFWSYFQKPLSVYAKMTNIDLMKDLLSQMLERDPSKRPNMSQILKHPWLASIQNYFLQEGN